MPLIFTLTKALKLKIKYFYNIFLKVKCCLHKKLICLACRTMSDILKLISLMQNKTDIYFKDRMVGRTVTPYAVAQFSQSKLASITHVTDKFKGCRKWFAKF